MAITSMWRIANFSIFVFPVVGFHGLDENGDLVDAVKLKPNKTIRQDVEVLSTGGPDVGHLSSGVIEPRAPLRLPLADRVRQLTSAKRWSSSSDRKDKPDLKVLMGEAEITPDMDVPCDWFERLHCCRTIDLTLEAVL